MTNFESASGVDLHTGSKKAEFLTLKYLIKGIPDKNYKLSGEI